MTSAYTIRIFVADGDPEGVKIIDRFNWTGKAFYFPRGKWSEIRKRPEFQFAGVYILVGDSQSDNDLPMIYVGEGDGICSRIDSHEKNKAFWSAGIAFVSANRGLNKAHVQWLEFALLAQARLAGRCTLDNGNVPTAPDLTESETADVQGFLNEILRILPLIGTRVFELPKPVATPETPSSAAVTAIKEAKPNTADVDFDTVIVPAQKEGFERVFLGEQCWYAIRISGGALPKLRWIAAYQSAPISSITHYAAVKSIEPYGDGSKYKIIFSEPAKLLPAPIPFADAPPGTMQSPRYTSLAKLLTAKKIAELL